MRCGAVAVIPRADRLLVIRRAATVEAPGAYCFAGRLPTVVFGASPPEQLVDGQFETWQETTGKSGDRPADHSAVRPGALGRDFSPRINEPNFMAAGCQPIFGLLIHGRPRVARGQHLDGEIGWTFKETNRKRACHTITADEGDIRSADRIRIPSDDETGFRAEDASQVVRLDEDRKWGGDVDDHPSTFATGWGHHAKLSPDEFTTAAAMVLPKLLGGCDSYCGHVDTPWDFVPCRTWNNNCCRRRPKTHASILLRCTEHVKPRQSLQPLLVALAGALRIGRRTRRLEGLSGRTLAVVHVVRYVMKSKRRMRAGLGN
jgi:hypothetical protein